jgi:hypothetical protein
LLAPAKSLGADPRWEVVYRLSTGSAAWWDSLNDGRIPLRTDSGIIKALYSSGADGKGTLDSCKFEDAWGHTLEETLYSDRGIAEKQYKLGRQVAFLYAPADPQDARRGSRGIVIEAAVGRTA